MAMYTSGPLEELQTCPYNVSHRITANRFAVHLVKCRKANRNAKHVTCPFYAGHKVPEPELAYHVSVVCDKRKELEQQLYQEQPKTQKWEVERSIPVETDESWEVSDRPSYNPQLYCEQNRIIRTMQVEPPSVRKEFRASERERHRKLNRLDGERNRKALHKADSCQGTEISEREQGTTSDASGVTIPSQSDIAAPKEWSKILYGRGRGSQDLPSHPQNINQKHVAMPPPRKVLSEISEREDATTSDVSTVCDSLSDLSVDAEPKRREDEWVKVSTGRGRGRGRKVKK